MTGTPLNSRIAEVRVAARASSDKRGLVVVPSDLWPGFFSRGQLDSVRYAKTC